MRPNTLKNWGNCQKELAFHTLSAVYYITLHLKLLQTATFDGIRYGFRAEDAKNLDDIYVNVVKALVMAKRAGSCNLPLVCHLVTTMLTIRKLAKSVPLFKTSKKSLRITTSSLDQQLQRSLCWIRKP